MGTVYMKTNYNLLGEAKLKYTNHILLNKSTCIYSIQNMLGLQVIPLEKYRSVLAPYWQTGSHKYLNEIEEIILGVTKAYVFFARHYGDLHSYVRRRRRLKEHEASRLFLQIVHAVLHCHESGVVLRDLKLRKFVFKNPERWGVFPVPLSPAEQLQLSLSSIFYLPVCPKKL